MVFLKHVGASGATHEFEIDRFEPCDYDTLRRFLKDERCTHQAHALCYLVDASRNRVGVRCRIGFDIELDEQVPLFGLLEGGFLPAPYLMGLSLLLDRNALHSLRQLRGSNRLEHNAARWVFAFLDTPTTRVNPITVAFEGGHQRTPTIDEFRSELREAERVVAAQLPQAVLTKFSDDTLRTLHDLRRSCDRRSERETSFLLRVAPLLRNRVAAARLERTENAIVVAARDAEVQIPSLVFLAAMSTLYESEDGGPARTVLKIGVSPYTSAEAYNALADLRQLEILGALGGSVSPALLTADRSLALLWCALGISALTRTERNVTLSIKPLVDLFPRLNLERSHEWLGLR